MERCFVQLYLAKCFWKRCNNQRRKRFPCLTRCLGKTSLFIWYTRFPGCSKNPDHKYFPGIWPVLQIFLLTHARLVRRRNAKDEKLSGCPPRAPCQESFILSETCSPQIGRKTLDRQTQGQLPCLAFCMSLTQCYCWDFKIIILVSRYTCQIVYADCWYIYFRISMKTFEHRNIYLRWRWQQIRSIHTLNTNPGNWFVLARIIVFSGKCYFEGALASWMCKGVS